MWAPFRNMMLVMRLSRGNCLLFFPSSVHCEQHGRMINNLILYTCASIVACYNVNEHNSILSPQTLQFFCSLVMVNLTFEVLGLNTRVEQPASLEVLISLN